MWKKCCKNIKNEKKNENVCFFQIDTNIYSINQPWNELVELNKMNQNKWRKESAAYILRTITAWIYTLTSRRLFINLSRWLTTLPCLIVGGVIFHFLGKIAKFWPFFDQKSVLFLKIFEIILKTQLFWNTFSESNTLSHWLPLLLP